jgi:hypothetical protein
MIGNERLLDEYGLTPGDALERWPVNRKGLARPWSG